MRRLATSASVLMILAACGSAGEMQNVQKVADARQRALTTKDKVLYASLLSSAYGDGTKNATSKIAEISALLNSFDQIEARFSNRKIEFVKDSATVTSDYELKVTSKNKSWKFSGTERIKLRKETGGWKIIGGL